MTQQEIFDRVCGHLALQRQPSTSGNGQCAYRGLEGRRCAVGILITDEEYQPRMEGVSACNLVKQFEQLDRLRPHAEFLMALQDAHDNCYGPDALQHRLYGVSQTYGLDPSAVGLIEQWDYQQARMYVTCPLPPEAQAEYYQAQDEDDDEDDEQDQEESEEEEEEEDTMEKELVCV